MPSSADRCAWTGIIAQVLTNQMTLCRVLSPSEPWLPHLWNRKISSNLRRLYKAIPNHNAFMAFQNPQIPETKLCLNSTGSKSQPNLNLFGSRNISWPGLSLYSSACLTPVTLDSRLATAILKWLESCSRPCWRFYVIQSTYHVITGKFTGPEKFI